MRRCIKVDPDGYALQISNGKAFEMVRKGRRLMIAFRTSPGGQEPCEWEHPTIITKRQARQLASCLVELAGRKP